MTGMKLGISTAIFFPRLYTEDALDVIKQSGCTVAEVFLNTYSEYGSDFTALLNQRRGALEVHSVHSLSNSYEPELFNRNPRVYNDASKLLNKVLAAGKAMGAKNYTFHGPPRLKKVPYNFDYGYIAECLNRLAGEAKPYGMNIAYENVHWCFFSTPDYFANLKDKCPDLKATLDIKQAILGGVPVGEFIDAMGDRIETVHICDIYDKNKTALPGRGEIDFSSLFKSLKKANYGGPVILEVYSKDYDDFKEVFDCCDYVRGIMRKEGVLTE